MEDFDYTMTNNESMMSLFEHSYQNLHNQMPKKEQIPEEAKPLPPLYYADALGKPAMSLFDEVTDYDYHSFHEDPKFNWFPNDGLSDDNDNNGNSAMSVVPMSKGIKCIRKKKNDNLWINFMLYKEFDPVLYNVNYIYNQDYDICYLCFKRMKKEIEERHRRDIAIMVKYNWINADKLFDIWRP